MSAKKLGLLIVLLLCTMQSGITQVKQQHQFTIDRECDVAACHFQIISFKYGRNLSFAVGIGDKGLPYYFSVRINKDKSTKEYILRDEPVKYFVEKDESLAKNLSVIKHDTRNEKKVDKNLNQLLLDVYDLGNYISEKNLETRGKRFSETGRYSILGDLRNYKDRTYIDTPPLSAPPIQQKSGSPAQAYIPPSQTVTIDPNNGSQFMPPDNGGVVLVPVPKVDKNGDSASKINAATGTVESDDLVALYFFLENNISPQGEFEKSADYDKRVTGILEREVYASRNGNSLWTGVDRPRDLNYDPDAELMDVRTRAEGFPLMPLEATGIMFPIKDNLAKGLRWNQLALQVVNYDAFFRSNPSTRLEHTGGYVKIRVSNGDGPSVKANLKIAYRFHVVKPFTGATAAGFIKIFVNLDSLRLFDSQSGKVYYDSNLRKPVANPTRPKRH